MDFETRELFTDAMQEAFKQLPTYDTDENSVQYENDPMWYVHVRIREFQSMHEQGLQDIDWTQVESQLDTRVMDCPDGDDDTSAYEYTKTLFGAAFEDAELLIVRAMEALPNDLLIEKDVVADTLRSSRNTLLHIALIGEEEHRKIIDSPEGENPLEYDGEKVQWTDEARSLLRKFRHVQEDGRGCPAHYRTIDFQGRHTTLLHAFWDSLIDYVFEPVDTDRNTLADNV